MLERDGFPPGVPCWIDTEQPDPLRRRRLLPRPVRLDVRGQAAPEAPGHYLIATLDDRVVAAVSSPARLSASPPVWNTYIGVADADAAAHRVGTAGGTVVSGPDDVGEAGRMVVCRDPDGAPFRLWQPRRRTGVELVNTHGTWNFSDLNTNRAERAKAFYGEVFGWTVDVLDLGATKATLWMQPGYGDFLARFDPEIRARQAADGAPDAFADAVAWLVDLDQAPGAGSPDPFWSVTFAVDDTDGVVEQAVALGATVVSPVTDLGVVRVATLRDPQGAELIVSHYQPENVAG